MYVNLDLAYSYKNKAALVLIFNQGKILSVSRKTDTTQRGLVGGKVENNETFLQAAIRETKEETGLDVFGLIPIFSRTDNDFFCVVYIGQWKGEIKPQNGENGIVEWVDFEDIKIGPFGEYNTKLEEHLIKNKLI